MAKRKKPRTPAPPRRPAAPRSSTDGNGAQAQTSAPRPVQAPKVRAGKRRTQADTDRRNRMILYGAAGAGIVGLVVAVLAVFVLGKGGTSTAHFDGPNVDFANLPGLMRKAPPWPKNTAQLRQRLAPLGLTPLGQEGQVLHIHQHLDIYVNGKHVTVPPLIGIKAKGTNLDFITELHTHSTDGVIHLESPVAQTYSLGQFFGAWGLNLSKNCIGNLCSPAGQFGVYINGKKIPATADPVRLVLQQHDEIAIVYGTPPAKIPSSFNWPAGE
jgi:hypothetical protein